MTHIDFLLKVLPTYVVTTYMATYMYIHSYYNFANSTLDCMLSNVRLIIFNRTVTESNVVIAILESITDLPIDLCDLQTSNPNDQIIQPKHINRDPSRLEVL